MPKSAQGWAASATIDAEPVTMAAKDFAIATRRLAPRATSTVSEAPDFLSSGGGGDDGDGDRDGDAGVGGSGDCDADDGELDDAMAPGGVLAAGLASPLVMKPVSHSKPSRTAVEPQ